MFAIVLGTSLSRTLYFAGNRIGEKPLYYVWTDSGADRRFVFFGSELNALRTYAGFAKLVCRKTLAQTMALAIQAVTSSSHERERLVNYGNERVQVFSFQGLAKQIEALYLSLMAAPLNIKILLRKLCITPPPVCLQ